MAMALVGISAQYVGAKGAVDPIVPNLEYEEPIFRGWADPPLTIPEPPPQPPPLLAPEPPPPNPNLPLP
ncbi:MAG: hypothetical protein JSV74_03345 [Dehalococcoidia bacterium]|nr:MAG: hypothetical protein JSV74_03345 [Dehalococcoidia bacterium]